MAFRGFRAAFGDIVRPAHGEVAGEQEDLFLVVAQPGAEGVAGVVPVVPVPEPVVDPERFHCGQGPTLGLWNQDARPFKWTKTAAQIIDRISRYCSRILNRLTRRLGPGLVR